MGKVVGQIKSPNLQPKSVTMKNALSRPMNQDKLLKDVNLLIDLKIRNIETATHRAIHSQVDLSASEATLAMLSSLFPNNDKVISLIEKYSKATQRLRLIRSLLEGSNVLKAIDLLSNDKFLFFQEESLRSILGKTSNMITPKSLAG